MGRQATSIKIGFRRVLSLCDLVNFALFAYRGMPGDESMSRANINRRDVYIANGFLVSASSCHCFVARTGEFVVFIVHS